MSARWFGLAAVALLALVWGFLPAFSITLLANIGLYALVALGLVLLTGVGGMTSFGQAAFVGIGAYATAWVCTAPGVAAALGLAFDSVWLPWLGLVLGLLCATALAWLLGGITVRLSGHYLPLGTIAWGLSLYFLFGNLEFLGGHTGITGLPALQLGAWQLSTARELGVLIWVLVLLAIVALHNLLDSRPGRALRALKSGRVMAESMGVDTARSRLQVFLLAALLAALSGWLYAHLQRFVNPTPFSLNIGIEYLFMAVVGGVGHLWGAVLGAALITLMKHYLQDLLPALLGASGNFEVIVFGLLMLLVLQRFPQGVWPLLVQLASPWVKVPVPMPAQNALALPQRPLPAAGSLVLQAQCISKHFGGLVANHEVDLDLKAGEIHALIGPNGAGKSTFFNIVSGVDNPSAGRVMLAGHDLSGQPARDFAQRGLGRTFQHVRLLGTRSVLENVALGAHLCGQRGWLAAMLRLDRVQEATLLAQARVQITRCGLAEFSDKPAGSLALGQQRLVEIARALAGQPSLLLLDEPAAGLRHLEKQALAHLLAELSASGVAVLLVEHDMEFVMNLAQRVTVLEFGRVIARGTPEQVQADPRVREAYLGAAEPPPVASTLTSVAMPRGLHETAA